MPFWKPTTEIIQNSNIYKMMQKLDIDSYQEFHKWSVANKELFWEQTVENLGIVQEKKYTSILDTSEGVENAKWLYGAKINIVDSCFQNEPDATVVTFQKEGDSLQKINQKTLENQVNKAANGLLEAGVHCGDSIAIDMPMTLESVIIYLAAIKAGIVVVTIADSFTPDEIAVRLEITKPKLLFTQDVFLRKGKIHPLYEKIKEASDIKIIVVETVKNAVQLKSYDAYWNDFLSQNTQFTSVKLSPEETITILFSSGTTGQPKAIPWNHTTPIKGASDGYYHHNIQKNNVICWPTNLGWMMGPWLVFAALINKASIALYYGSPTHSAFGKFVEEAKVTMLGVIPSIVKFWKLEGIMENFDWNSIQCFSSTGEVSNPTEMDYLMNLSGGKPIIEYCGGTEIGGGYIASTIVQENYASQFSTKALGGDFVLLNEQGKESTEGEVFLIPPVMGLSTKLINRNHHETYYKGIPTYKNQVLRKHGDQFLTLENGYFKARGRTDDAMNLGGIKVSAVQIETVLNTLDFIKEAAAIAVSPQSGGSSVLVIYYVSSENIQEKEALKKAQNCVKTKLNPLFKVSDLVKIDNLPRTASNKIIRKELRNKYQLESQMSKD